MINLNFNTLEEFEQLFSYTNKKVVDGICNSINEAYLFSRKSAKIFNISFQDKEMSYEISLPLKEWPEALSTCLKYYEDNGESDQCIDTWKLKDNIEKFHIK
tara:strand:- start:41 stop:346 length:306 start_codon:yes stop_codon:yes gene_type:complete